MKDQDVITQVLSGNRDAYGLLVDRYYKGLFNHLFLMLKEADAAEDVCQTAFIKVFYALENYNPEYKFSTWLYRIGTNEGLKALQHKQPIGLDEIPELPDRYDPNEAQAVEAREAKVRLAVTQLSLKYQTVISLHYWQGLKYEEVAQVMDVPVGTIKIWLHRAKNELKQILDSLEEPHE